MFTFFCVSRRTPRGTVFSFFFPNYSVRNLGSGTVIKTFSPFPPHNKFVFFAILTSHFPMLRCLISNKANAMARVSPPSSPKTERN